MKPNELAQEALRQKAFVLAKENRVGYAPIPHDIYRKLLPELKAKYDGQTARDCVILYGYMQAFVNGESEKEVYMWAYPTVAQIVEDTGIHKDRVKKLVDILVSEGVMKTKRIPWYGHTKKMYLPLYLRNAPIPTSGIQSIPTSGNQSIPVSGNIIRTN